MALTNETKYVTVRRLNRFKQKLDAAGSTAYHKPSGGIPKSDLEDSVQISLGKADTALQSHQDISRKADKVSSPTNGNLAGLDSNGNLTDSGKKPSDFATAGHNHDSAYAPLNIVPSQASSENQLADKAFVNSSISTATATYRGAYNLVSDLSLTISATESQIATALASAISTADNNDYCYVQVPTANDKPTEIARVDRYKHNGTAWALEYAINNSGFTAAQWSALNSGITSGLVSKLSALPSNTDLQAALGAKYVKPSGGIPKTDLESAVQTSLGKADTALQSHQDISGKADKSSTVSTVAYDTTNKKLTKTINGTTTDVVTALQVVADGMGLQLNPVSLTVLSADYTFKKYDAMVIDGIIYRCTADTTTKPPFNFVFDDTTGAIVYETLNGVEVFTVDSDTLNTGWEALMDIRDRYYIELVRQSLQSNLDTAAANIHQELGVAYGICETDGATAAKTVIIPNFRLVTNRAVSILFTNGFSATSPTLNVSGTGAKPILYFSEAIAPGKVRGNTILTMQYDGTSWNVVFIQPQASVPSMAVDLGLPSGLLWADRNVGAVSPEDYGFYNQWGVTDVQDKDSYDYSSSNYSNTEASAISDDLTTYQDFARSCFGQPWRMPTEEEFQELIDNCTASRTLRNGVAGTLMTSNINGNSIFFPAAGEMVGTTAYDKTNQSRCWTSTYIGGTSAKIAVLQTSAGIYQGYRFHGSSVRAVM